jgi:hypothetical protein
MHLLHQDTAVDPPAAQTIGFFPSRTRIASLSMDEASRPLRPPCGDGPGVLGEGWLEARIEGGSGRAARRDNEGPASAAAAGAGGLCARPANVAPPRYQRRDGWMGMMHEAIGEVACSPGSRRTTPHDAAEACLP